ncbi:MAG: hypothetical protein ABI882_09735, partial [Acidobacteriota bacterium]
TGSMKPYPDSENASPTIRDGSLNLEKDDPISRRLSGKALRQRPSEARTAKGSTPVRVLFPPHGGTALLELTSNFRQTNCDRLERI